MFKIIIKLTHLPAEDVVEALRTAILVEEDTDTAVVVAKLDTEVAMEEEAHAVCVTFDASASV